MIKGFMRFWHYMESQKRINSVIMDIHNWIIDSHNSIMDIHYYFDWIMGIHNWIMDIHNWIMDIYNYRVYALLAFHGKPKAHKPYNYG